jgi:hypothetical protein
MTFEEALERLRKAEERAKQRRDEQEKERDGFSFR